MNGIGCAANKTSNAFKSCTISKTRLSRCCCSVSLDRLYQSANNVNKHVRNGNVWCFKEQDNQSEMIQFLLPENSTCN